MQRRQILGGLAVLALTAAVIDGLTWPAGKPAADGAAMTPLEGEALSPDGKYEVRQLDEGGDGEPVPSMETVRVVDTAAGDVLWEDSGDYETAALWSPDGRYLALSKRGRAYGRVTVLETETFTSWDIPLPAEVRSAEYALLRAVEWLDGHTLRFQYQDIQADSTDAALFYRCFLRVEDGGLTGDSSREATEILSRDYDFDHDGAAELTELVTLWEPESDRAALYEVQVRRADGSLLWSETAADFHAGENSLYALKLDGQDYLLRYNPYMGQGFCTYAYQLFSLDQGGQPVICKENRVEFDINFGPVHGNFGVELIAAFLHEVHGYLDTAQELVSTVWGEISLGEVDYSDTAALETALEAYQKELSR